MICGNQHVPREIFALLCFFAYGVCPKKHFLVDLDEVLAYQRAIPPILLRRMIPTRPLFTGKGVPVGHEDLFQPNPYRSGSPYLPQPCVFGWVWSELIIVILDHLRVDVVRQNHRYRGVLYRNASRHIRAGCISHWNKILSDFFKDDFWSDHTSFWLYPRLSRDLIRRFAKQIRQASFVPPHVPLSLLPASVCSESVSSLSATRQRRLSWPLDE